jgi:hypothetical protein
LRSGFFIGFAGGLSGRLRGQTRSFGRSRQLRLGRFALGVT